MGGAALGAIGGGAIGGIFSLAGQAVANKESERSQRRAYVYAKNMYRHRYQWQMRDMALAGLNPILAYQQGAPGTPGVGTYQGAPTSGLGETIVSSAKAGAKIGEELEILAHQKDITKAQIVNVAADTLQKETQAGANRASEDKISAEANAVRLNTLLQSTALPGAQTRKGVDVSPPGQAAIWWNQIIRNLIGLGPSAVRRAK